MAKITIVDDAKLLRDLIRRSLVGLGHEVQAVDPLSLFDVLKAVRGFMPEVVVLDSHMPGCSAESLVRALREDSRLKHLKILVLSDHHDEEVVTSMLRRGVDGFVLKGHTPTLLARVRELIP
jgi:CheY-like chemotaxis protein